MKTKKKQCISCKQKVDKLYQNNMCRECLKERFKALYLALECSRYELHGYNVFMRRIQ